jgi:hypothetical protein
MRSFLDLSSFQDMTAVEPRTATFDSLDPATGEVVGTHPIHDAAHVGAVVDRPVPRPPGGRVLASPAARSG